MHIWCTTCERLCAAEAKDQHEGHRLVGIRSDILIDILRRAVADLHRTGRLESIQ
jgi:hypothetical protein